MSEDYVLKLDKQGLLSVPTDISLFFLCGVKFNKEADKRLVMKKYLAKHNIHGVILEEHFPVTTSYRKAGIYNLFDVETLAAAFADGIIVIHESLSTAAEIGVFAANEQTVEKMLIAHPSSFAVEESKISGFMNFAFVRMGDQVLPKESLASFEPILNKHYNIGDRYSLHTAFPDDLNSPSAFTEKIDAFIADRSPKQLTQLHFKKPQKLRAPSNNPTKVNYSINESGVVKVWLSIQALRHLLSMVLCCEGVDELVEECTSIYDVVEVLTDELERLILSTLKHGSGVAGNEVKISIKQSVQLGLVSNDTTPYRKAIGLYVYMLKALGYLSIEKGEKFKFTQAFGKMKKSYETSIVKRPLSVFEKEAAL